MEPEKKVELPLYLPIEQIKNGEVKKTFQFKIQKHGVYFPEHCPIELKLQHHRHCQGFFWIHSSDYSFYETQFLKGGKGKSKTHPRPSLHGEEFNLEFHLHPENWFRLELSEKDITQILKQSQTKSCFRLAYVLKQFQINESNCSIEKPWKSNISKVKIKGHAQVISLLMDKLRTENYLQRLQKGTDRLTLETDEHIPKAPVFFIEPDLTKQIFQMYPCLDSNEYSQVFHWKGCDWLPTGFYQPPERDESYLVLVHVIPKEQYLSWYGPPTCVLNQTRVFLVGSKGSYQEYCDHWGVVLLKCNV